MGTCDSLTSKKVKYVSNNVQLDLIYVLYTRYWNAQIILHFFLKKK